MALSSRGPMGRSALALWALLFSFYGVTGTGHSSFSDGWLLFLTARNLLDHGTFAVPPPDAERILSHRRQGVDGRYYVSFGPGLAIAHLPMLAVGRALSPLRPEVETRPADDLQRDEFFAQLTNAGVMATVIVFLFVSGTTLGFPAGASLLVAGLAAIASPLWPYARLDSTEALQAFGLIAAFHALARSDSSTRVAPPVLAGLCLGVAIVAKAANLVLVPAFAAYTLFSSRRPLLRTARLLVGTGIVVALLAFHNYARFGSPFDAGYDLSEEGFTHPFVDGAAGLLTSLSYGMLVFWPAFLLVPFGLVPLFRRRPREAALALGVFGILLVVYSTWWAWWGMLWGPRFLVPAIPLLALFLLPLASSPTRAGGIALVAAAAAGLAVQLVVVAFGFWTHVEPVRGHLATDTPARLIRDPQIAPLRIGAWWASTTFARLYGREAESLDILLRPPWGNVYPWRDPKAVLAELAPLRGIDLWAAPDALRLKTLYVPRPSANVPVPTSPGLRSVLLAVLAVASLVLLLTFRRERADPSG